MARFYNIAGLIGAAAVGLGAVLGTPALAGESTFAIDITALPGEDWGTVVEIARAAGAGATSLTLFWDDLVPEGTGYAPEHDWPAIANAYYPSQDLALTITFSVIDTLADRRRADLRGRAWDDPEVIAAFQHHLDEVLRRMPAVDLRAIAIGNEIDAFLTESDEIAAFARFLASARDAVEALRPGVPVGTKLTMGGFVSAPAAWRQVLAESAALMITYYPLDAGFRVRPAQVVARDLDALLAVAPDLPVYLLEAGYPSAGCGASPEAQADFVRRLLDEAERRRDRIKLVSLDWLTDISAAELDAYTGYYAQQGPCFRRFLGSLGLRDTEGRPKPALDWLIERP